VDVSELRVGDLLTFLAVARSSSLTSAARERKVTPSQVSKAITRVEQHFGKKLVERGSRGVLLSDTGRRLRPMLESVVAQLEAARSERTRETTLNVGAPSYLQAAFLGVLAKSAPEGVRLRGFELPPSLLRANAEDERYEILLLVGEPGHLAASWEAEEVGVIRKGLFAAPALASSLGPSPVSPEALVDVPWVAPIYRREGRVVPVDDDCPLPRSRRRVGHEVGTIIVALDVAAATSHLVFGPVIAAERHLRAGTLVEISVAGWDEREPFVLAYNVDRVSAKLRAAFAAAMSSAARM